MDNVASSSASNGNRGSVERKSDRELVVTRSFDAPARLVFEAWSRPELFRKWWVPKSAGVQLLSCEMDVRTGGTYRLEFAAEGGSRAFYGKYVEVVPGSLIVWTNEESDGGAVTTVRFEERDGKTFLTFHELYPSKEALEESFVGMEDAMPEQFAQLEELLGTLGVEAGSA